MPDTDTGLEGGGALVKAKELGLTVVAYPMLNLTNYTVWAPRMKVVL